MTPLILGLSGTALNDEERGFFREVDPAGFILFKRNVSDRAQVKALTDELRTLSGRDDVPILIDQEGGRVARMQPPQWPAFPRGSDFDRLYDVAPMSAIEAIRANAQALAAMLREVGVNVDALPLLDVRQPGAHDIIGDRALGTEPLRVAAPGRATLEGLKAGGAVGVIKHMPGHGRAMSDSHVELPVVEASAEELETDIAPFHTLNWAPMGMTAHVVYTAWDKDQPGSLSAKVIGEIIRGRIGFDGLLMSDDLGMHALKGNFTDRAAGVIAAGCDIALHCSGDMDEMRACAKGVSGIAPHARGRLDAAMATIAGAADSASFDDLVAKRDALLALA